MYGVSWLTFLFCFSYVRLISSAAMYILFNGVFDVMYQ